MDSQKRRKFNNRYPWRKRKPQEIGKPTIGKVVAINARRNQRSKQLAQWKLGAGQVHPVFPLFRELSTRTTEKEG